MQAQAIEAVITWERFVGTVEEAEELSTTTEIDTAELLIDRYGQFRKYTKELLSVFSFQGVNANAPLIEALQVLKNLNETGKRTVPESAPIDFVKGHWEKHVMQDEQIERHAYELCTLSELRSGLRSGDVWIAGSRRYKAFEDYLMPQGQWQWLKQIGETEVKIPADFATYIAERKEALHRELRSVEKLLAEEKLPDVRQVKGKLVITPLAKVIPDEVEALTRQVYDVLPRIKLPDLLLEVDAWTGFSRHFTHLQSGDTPKDRTALFAALLADAINLGYSRMADACIGMTSTAWPGLSIGIFGTKPIPKRLRRSLIITTTSHLHLTGVMAPPLRPTVSALKWEDNQKQRRRSISATGLSQGSPSTPICPISMALTVSR
jgi:hypothetical protein